MTRAGKPTITNIQAVVFDMDGTLIDSEPLTGLAIAELLASEGIEASVAQESWYFGVTWEAISAELTRRHPAIAGRCEPAALDARFRRLGQERPPPPLPGAFEAVASASASHRTAIATSSHRASVDDLFARTEVAQHVDVVVASEDYTRSKPDPECFLLAARRLGVEPASCLVFEDSTAGVQAARNAGMRVVAVGSRIRESGAEADVFIPDYRALPTGFFASIRTR